MHSANHIETPHVHLATGTDEVLLGVEYFTPSKGISNAYAACTSPIMANGGPFHVVRRVLVFSLNKMTQCKVGNPNIKRTF